MKRYITSEMLKVSACVSCLLVLCLLSTPASAVTVDASDYGYNPADATSALQSAINTGADTVIVPYMGPGNDWIVEPIFLTAGNQTIIFEEDSDRAPAHAPRIRAASFFEALGSQGVGRTGR